MNYVVRILSAAALLGSCVPAETAPRDASITLTINPEARISASITGPLPPPGPCGTVAIVDIRVVNQSFVTSQLQARLVADIPTDISLDFHPEPLEGKPEEMRSLGIKLSQPGFTDLTVSFYARGDKTELGGRDRVHLLMRCFNEASHPVGRPHSEG